MAQPLAKPLKNNDKSQRMKKLHSLDVDSLWRLQRVGPPALSPDGAQAVCGVTRFDATSGAPSTQLWLLSTLGGGPRQLTACGDKHAQAAWSPQGERVAFVAKRKQANVGGGGGGGGVGGVGVGGGDDTPQLYTIAADGGEAQRHGLFAPGIESFKWLPDGRHVVFSAWTWPGLKGAAAQARHYKAFKDRKDTAYVTAEGYYRYWDHNIPQDRVLHLWRLDLASGKATDLFEGSTLQLPREASGSDAFDVHPSGRCVAFVHDPAAMQVAGQPQALTELDLRTRRSRTLVADVAWDIAAPSYSPDGQHLAFIASNVGTTHTAPLLLGLLKRGQAWDPTTARGAVWDHSLNAPLRWAADGQSLLFTAEERGRCHLWRHDLASGNFRIQCAGGWVQGFDLAGQGSDEVVVTAADSAMHPVRIHALRGSGALGASGASGALCAVGAVSPALRLETFNDAELAQLEFGQVQEIEVTGALGQPVQVWLVFPVGFNRRKKHPLLQVIHGGPFAAAGDTFSYRWNAHLLAGRGHVVAQVNYHGSSGFGQAFKESLIGRQGELELQDIEAATDWLLQQPWADKRRVFASGGSYGGFLVAWMNGHIPYTEHPRYRAYVCHAGVFDRVATFSADSYTQRPKDLAASYWSDMPRVLAQSPHAFAARMQTPTLVIHGAQDFRVPDCNGLAYYNTLKARGVDARLLWFPDENHWVLKMPNAKMWVQEFLAWLDRHDSKSKRS